ncbi:hypothetical protein H0E84_07645 [Luteimonas sp. SJ-92]|uniref:Uncharacterized protein n=1 Tax=Luteimonas salinisoli TaxID=2752307 RepID=A0A853JC82_9GAMM|nr:hypothetical protein [Luteimonas salinisoli]NZA26257.1 hypothetical protein [Luteimonas salinisoli]
MKPRSFSLSDYTATVIFSSQWPGNLCNGPCLLSHRLPYPFRQRKARDAAQYHAFLALVPRSPNLAVTILTSLANGLLVLIGLFAVVGLGDYGISPFEVASAWVGAVIVPAINVLAVLVWRVAAQSNNSFKPKPLRGSA